MGQDRRPLDSRNNKEVTFTSFIQWLFDRRSLFKKWRLKKYKRKKVMSAMTAAEKQYMIRFKIRLDDTVNPQQVGDKVYEMLVPARAAYFAKKKLKSAIKLKIQADVVDVDALTSDEVHSYRKSMETFLETKKDKT